jgi:hypothetical protein
MANNKGKKALFRQLSKLATIKQFAIIPGQKDTFHIEPDDACRQLMKRFKNHFAIHLLGDEITIR